MNAPSPKQRIGHPVRLVVSIAAMLLLTAGKGAAGSAGTSFAVETRKKGDKVEVTGNEAAAVFHVFSSDGIGSATIKLIGRAWPSTLIVRLNLQSLEFFKVSNGKLTLEGRLKSSVWETRDPRELTIPSAIRQEDGFVEVPLPGLLFRDNANVIHFEWINAYR